MTAAETQLLAATEQLYKLMWGVDRNLRFQQVRKQAEAALRIYESSVPADCLRAREQEAKQPA
jgi:hypothetical protein